MDDLIVKFLQEDITADEVSQLKDWLALSDHKEHFREYFLTWKYASMQGNHEFDPEKAFNKLQYKLHNLSAGQDKGKIQVITSRRALVNMILKWAAVFLIFIACGAILYNIIRSINSDSPGKQVNVEITVPMGSKSMIKLPDGTVVWLNAGSILTYDQIFGEKTRDIHLSGEGYFIVAQNKRIPFVVHTSDAIIRAVGTEFNIKAYPDEDKIETILVKGSVVIQKLTDNKAKNVSTKEKGRLLTPGEKAVVYRAGFKTHGTDVSRNKSYPTDENAKNKLESISIIQLNTLHETTWKSSRWVIKDESIAGLKMLLERHYNIVIKKIDTELMNYRFSGTIENETLEELMEIIALTIPMSYSINKGSVTLQFDKTLLNKYQNAYN